MCRAFSAIVLESGKVLWEMGIDSHDDLLREFKIADRKVNPNFARVEYAPQNGNYWKPDKWVFRLDERIEPTWWKPIYETYVIETWGEWWKKICRIVDFKKPIVYPFRDIVPPKKITKKHLDLLKQWASVRASVGASVWDSVWASVGDSVRASVRASVRDSVWASVWVYIGSFFRLPRKAWKYTDKIKGNGYPFQPGVDLWMMGLVPSFDGKLWRLHGGPDARIVWEGEINVF